MSIQNIMNVCFAICITLLIYQNTQLKDEIETVKGFSQLDVDKSWGRMELNHDQLAELIEIINAQVILNEENIDNLFGNFEIAQEREDKRKEGLKALVEQVEKNAMNIKDVLGLVGDLHNLN